MPSGHLAFHFQYDRCKPHQARPAAVEPGWLELHDLASRIKPERLIIPVFRPPEVLGTICRAQAQHPDFTKYAVVRGDCLDFHEVLPAGNGMEVRHLGKYYTVEEQKFWDFVEHPEMEKRVEFLRCAIDRRFRPDDGASIPIISQPTDHSKSLSAN